MYHGGSICVAALLIMFYSRPPYIIYRDYPECGYLTDNRNYGYDTADKSSLKVGDRILDKIGSIIYSELSDTPKSIKEISTAVSRRFENVSSSVISQDITDLLKELSEDGFVWGCENPDNSVFPRFFSYKDKKDEPVNIVKEEISVADEGRYDGKWFDGYRLLRIHIGISWACNERCVHCYFPNEYRAGIMPRSMFDKILSQAREKNVLNITLSGGEPMLNSNLVYFIRQCRIHNFSINLLTNLTLLTEPILNEIKATPLISIQTSLYSMDECIHDAITQQKGSFGKTKQAIELLHRYNIPMHINCPIMKQNKESYKEVLEWAKSMNIEAGFDYMLFGCFDGSCKNLNCRLDLSDIEHIVENDKNNAPQDVVDKDMMCPVCQSSLCISPKGDVYPCEGWQSLVMGNINDTSLSEIWENGELANQLRSLTIKDFSKCSSCGSRDFCNICLIRNVNESKKLDYKDTNSFFCSVADIRKREFLRTQK